MNIDELIRSLNDVKAFVGDDAEVVVKVKSTAKSASTNFIQEQTKANEVEALVKDGEENQNTVSIIGWV